MSENEPRPSASENDVLTQLTDGRQVGTDELIPIVYENLRRLAASFFQGEDSGATLQPTALVHEAYIKLLGQEQGEWANQAHFLAIAGRVMRRVLVDAARARKSEKRGGALKRVTLLDDATDSPNVEVDITELDEALQKLASVKERFVQIAELHYFSGLTLEEVGRVLGIGRSTVVREWAQARAWLAVELEFPRAS